MTDPIATQCAPENNTDDRAGNSTSLSGEIAGWSIVAILVILEGLNVWTGQLDLGDSLAVSNVLLIGGFSALIVMWSSQRAAKFTQISLLVCAVLGVVFLATQAVLRNPSYGTDEISFDQYAAQLLLHGVNPYVHSMAPSLARFHVPDIYRTYTLSGTTITRLSYPAASFLFYLPSLLFGLNVQAAVATDLVMWILSCLLLWVLLPINLKWMSAVLLIADMYLYMSVGGVTDVVYMPFLILALWRWDDFYKYPSESWRKWMAPVTLGIACAVKQTPWFLIPFLVIGLAVECRDANVSRWKVIGQYLGAVSAVFVFINLPFILWSPSQWLRDVVVPLTTPTEPGGQGLIGWTIFEHFGGQLRFFSLAGALVFGASIFAFLGWYPLFKRSWPFLVAATFFFPTRSFGSYLIMLIPAGLVAGSTCSVARYSGSRFARILTLALSAGVVGMLTLAALAKPALRLTILKEGSTGQLQSIDYLTLRVTNTSGLFVQPHYAVTPTGQISSFWNVINGPKSFGPHERATVTLEAPNFESMPSIEGGFIVDAFSAHPSEMSSTSELRVNKVSTYLVSEYSDRIQPIRKIDRLYVEVVNQFGSAIHKSGIRVNLGQVIYAQTGLEFGEVSINGAAEGHTPVVAQTNAHGVASFTVEGVQTQSAPVFFQAWISRPGHPPTGYSNVVTIQFGR